MLIMGVIRGHQNQRRAPATVQGGAVRAAGKETILHSCRFTASVSVSHDPTRLLSSGARPGVAVANAEARQLGLLSDSRSAFSRSSGKFANDPD
jgi:hypothetical protein